MFYNRKENRGSDGNSGVRRATLCWYCVRAGGPGLEERRAMDTLKRKMTRGSDATHPAPTQGH